MDFPSTEDLILIFARSMAERWICQICRVSKVVPGLARDCERRHKEMWHGEGTGGDL
jgi:hypothetical protein